MRFRIRMVISCLVLIGLVSCGDLSVRNEYVKPEVCTEDWFWCVEQKLATSDEHGHGPDIGSLEWKSVVEFKLGVRGKAHVPSPKSRAWCELVETKLENVR